MDFSQPNKPAQTVWAIYFKSIETDGNNSYGSIRVVEMHETIEEAGKRLEQLEREYNRHKTNYHIQGDFFLEENNLYK